MKLLISKQFAIYNLLTNNILLLQIPKPCIILYVNVSKFTCCLIFFCTVFKHRLMFIIHSIFFKYSQALITLSGISNVLLHSCDEVTSYTSVSLLLLVLKLYENLLLKRLKCLIEEKCIVILHEFGFISTRTTIDQVHRMINVIEIVLEKKRICSALFLDIAQAFNKVWN